MIGKINCSQAFVFHLIVIPGINMCDMTIVCAMLINFQIKKREREPVFCVFFFLLIISTLAVKTFNSCSSRKSSSLMCSAVSRVCLLLGK